MRRVNASKRRWWASTLPPVPEQSQEETAAQEGDAVNTTPLVEGRHWCLGCFW